MADLNNPVRYMDRKTKRIMFTVQLEPDELFTMPDCAYFKRWVFQEEKGTHAHIQGYVELTQNRKLSWLSNIFERHGFPKPHLESAREKAPTCYTYCTKPETRVPNGSSGTFGDWSNIQVTQGRRSDLVEVYEACKAKRTLDELYEVNGAATIKYKRHLDQLHSHFHERHRNVDTHTSYLWFQGDAGTGKSTAAYNSAPPDKLYYKDLDGDGNWWDQLTTAHTTVVLDDYEGKGVSYGLLKRIADRFPVMVPYKGGYRKYHISRIIVTSNKWPWELWRDCEVDPMNNPNGLLSPIMRRFTFFKFTRDAHHRPGVKTLYWKPDMIKMEMTEEPDSPITPPYHPPVVDLTQSDED